MHKITYKSNRDTCSNNHIQRVERPNPKVKMQEQNQKKPKELPETTSIEHLLGRGFFKVRNRHLAKIIRSEDERQMLTAVYKQKGDICTYRGLLRYSLNQNVIHE